MAQDFNWKDYIKLESSDEEFGKQIEDILEQLSQTPEGQEIMKRGVLFNGGEVLTIKAQLEGKSGAQPGAGRVDISRSDIAKAMFNSADGGLLQSSLNRAIFHELYHMADEKTFSYQSATPAEQEAVLISILDEAITSFLEKKEQVHLVDKDGNKIAIESLTVDQKMGVLERLEQQKPGTIDYFVGKYAPAFLPHEKDAVASTNDFMSRHYGETPRESYAASEKGTPEMEVYTQDDKICTPQMDRVPQMEI